MSRSRKNRNITAVARRSRLLHPSHHFDYVWTDGGDGYDYLVKVYSLDQETIAKTIRRIQKERTPDHFKRYTWIDEGKYRGRYRKDIRKFMVGKTDDVLPFTPRKQSNW